MGKGRIISHEGDGQYIVAILHDRAAVDAELAQLAIDIAEIQNLKSELDDKLAEAKDAHEAALTALNEAIATRDDDGNIDRKVVTEKTVSAVTAEQVYRIAKIDVNECAGRLVDAQQRQAELQALPDEPEVTAWCADYSLELTGEVATAEVPGEPRAVLVRPGFEDDAQWMPERDGQLVHRAGMQSHQVYFNAAILPGWQKWKPTYRLGEITALDAGTADVLLDADTSSANEIPIDPPDGRQLSQVPIEYMDCDAIAFEVGDRVLVQFDSQDPEQAKVIGFESDPRPCQIACYGADFYGLVRNGEIELANGENMPVGMQDVGSGPSWELAPQSTPPQPSTPPVDGKTWRPYRLLNGNGDYVRTQNLLGMVIYCDPLGSAWMIDVAFSDVNDGLRVTATLMYRFVPIESGAAWNGYGQSINRALFDTVLPVRKEIAGYTDMPLSYAILHRSNNRNGSKWLFCGGLPKSQTFINTPIDQLGIFESAIEVTFSGSGEIDEASLGNGISATITRDEINQYYNIDFSSVSGGNDIVRTPEPVFDPDRSLPDETSVSISTTANPGSRVQQNWSFEAYREYRGDEVLIATGQAQVVETYLENSNVNGTIQKVYDEESFTWVNGPDVEYTDTFTNTIEVSRSLTVGGVNYSGAYTGVSTRTEQKAINFGFDIGDQWTYVTDVRTISSNTTSTDNWSGNFAELRLFNGVCWISFANSQNFVASCQGYTSEPVTTGPDDGMTFALNPVTGEMAIGLDVQTWL